LAELFRVHHKKIEKSPELNVGKFNDLLEGITPNAFRRIRAYAGQKMADIRRFGMNDVKKT
jgi:hypothetical protein